MTENHPTASGEPVYTYPDSRNGMLKVTKDKHGKHVIETKEGFFGKTHRATVLAPKGAGLLQMVHALLGTDDTGHVIVNRDLLTQALKAAFFEVDDNAMEELRKQMAQAGIHLDPLGDDPTPTTSVKRCCGTSVGGRLTRTNPATGQTEYAILGRAWWPIGWAPFAGHARDHGQESPEEAAIAEGAEELGIHITGLTELFSVHLPNLCASLPHQPKPGHLWTVYDIHTPTTVLTPAPGETTGAEWVTGEELQRLAEATVAFAHTGRPAQEQPRLSLEAVWVELLARAGDITISRTDRDTVARLYTTPPPEYWLGGRP